MVTVKKDENETNVLFELICHRYETGSLMIPANQPFSDWDKIFPDNMTAVAANEGEEVNFFTFKPAILVDI